AHHVACPDNADFSEHHAINPYFQSNAQQCVDLNREDSAEHSFILAIRSSLDMQMAKPLLSVLPKYLHIQHILGDTAPEWFQVGLQYLALETQQLRPGRDKNLDHLVSILLIECVRDYILNLENASSWLNALSNPHLSNALAAIHGQPEHPWSVQSLAAQCHMSRSKYAQVFTQIVSVLPLSFLQQHRLRMAAQYSPNSGFGIQ